MKNLARAAVIWGAFFSLPVAWATPPRISPLIFPMSANTLIEVEAYDAQTKFYQIKDVVLYGQGPWHTTAAQLAKAVHALNLARITRSPTSIVLNQYTTDEIMMVAAGPGKPPAVRPKPAPRAVPKSKVKVKPKSRIKNRNQR
jgi:hypothetical protein